MSTSWRSDDPNAGDEASKYENPVPSRIVIQQHLESRGAPARYEVLLEEFGIFDDNEQEGLRRRLIAMVRDGQLIQTRKGDFGLINKMDLIVGKVQGHRDGFGFVIPAEGGDDLFLTARQMKELFDGDRVVVRETDVDTRGRRYCAIIDILERSVTQVVGPYREEDGLGFVTPEGRRMTNDVVIEPGALMPTLGQMVLVDIKEYPTKRHMAIGVIREVLGDRMAPGMEIDIALRSHEIPHEWPRDVNRAVKYFKPEVAEDDKAHRIDMRKVPFVTIDGEDARDFDDAVFAEKKKSGGWRLYVAIADVSHYVRPGSALDKEAHNRGNSVYFPGNVIPMLPEVLSNGLCSLNPHVDRLAMICEMTVSAKGALSGYTFYEGVIQSHARLTYTKVGAMLERPEEKDGKALRKQYADVVPHVDELYNLYHALRTVRSDRGAIDFETTETRIIFGDNRKIDKIVPTVRNDAHKLIEECMLCANVATARFLEKHKLPALYRVHEGPTDKKLETLHKFMGELGLSLPGRNKPDPKDYQRLLSSIQERPDAHVIQIMMLRSLSQAVYTPENEGHFGLAYSAYAHFTSPIRRYPDLLVHRAIRYVIRSDMASRHVHRVTENGSMEQLTTKVLRYVTGTRNSAKTVTSIEGAPPMEKASYPYDNQKMAALGEHCSLTERRADDATRDVTDWLKCEYMQNHLGETFEGVIATVTGFGLFVELTDIFVTGLIHISNLPGDYYHYESSHQRLMGEKTGRRFQMGDPVTVQVARVDLEEKTIDFSLDGAPVATRSGRRSSHNESRRREESRGDRGRDRDSRPSGRGKPHRGRDSERDNAKARRATGRKPKPNTPKGADAGVKVSDADVADYRRKLLEERGDKDGSNLSAAKKRKSRSKSRKDKGKPKGPLGGGKTGEAKGSSGKAASTKKKPAKKSAGDKPATAKPKRAPRKRPAKK
ncbi:ribonuclease R [Parendozoicomonas sp. Alg238-R29]|uniref:ribonuclease R n=1 Tax=Parendozoicomonas sp. Alg238-R29 TaxID=2993446 RepID=UPI00248DFA63|nr:ribonuclease R [Parendozoicomonas sp. Alg238-R29]